MLMLVLVALCGAFSLLSFAASFAIARFSPQLRYARRVQIAGCLPTILYVIAMAVWHMIWLRAPEGYSPLIILIYGWWFVYPFIALNLAINCIAAGFPRTKP